MRRSRVTTSAHDAWPRRPILQTTTTLTDDGGSHSTIHTYSVRERVSTTLTDDGGSHPTMHTSLSGKADRMRGGHAPPAVTTSHGLLTVPSGAYAITHVVERAKKPGSATGYV